RVIRHPRARLRAQPGVRGPARRASVIGICASTGGPHILAGLLDAFPADYPIPILVVQHIAAGFTEGLARSLDGAVALPVGIAEESVRVRQGVGSAPEGAHVKISVTGHMPLTR